MLSGKGAQSFVKDGSLSFLKLKSGNFGNFRSKLYAGCESPDRVSDSSSSESKYEGKRVKNKVFMVSWIISGEDS